METFNKKVIELFNSGEYTQLRELIQETENDIIEQLRTGGMTDVDGLCVQLKHVKSAKILLNYKLNQRITYKPQTEHDLADGRGQVSTQEGYITKALHGFGFHFITDSHEEVWPKDIIRFVY